MGICSNQSTDTLCSSSDRTNAWIKSVKKALSKTSGPEGVTSWANTSSMENNQTEGGAGKWFRQALLKENWSEAVLNGHYWDRL